MTFLFLYTALCMQLYFPAGEFYCQRIIGRLVLPRCAALRLPQWPDPLPS